MCVGGCADVVVFCICVNLCECFVRESVNENLIGATKYSFVIPCLPFFLFSWTSVDGSSSIDDSDEY